MRFALDVLQLKWSWRAGLPRHLRRTPYFDRDASESLVSFVFESDLTALDTPVTPVNRKAHAQSDHLTKPMRHAS